MSEPKPDHRARKRSRVSIPTPEGAQSAQSVSQAVSGASMRVSLDYPPSCNRIWRNAGGRQYKPAAVVAWMASSAMLAKAAGIRPLPGGVHVSVTLHPRLTKAGKASAARIDLDNAIKATIDALQGVAFLNDKQVVRLTAEVGQAVTHGGLTVGVEAI